MPDQRDGLLMRLEAVGYATYVQEHRKLLKATFPDGDATPAGWNETSAEAIIKAVAAMIVDGRSSVL